jgi:hypothetical protein
MRWTKYLMNTYTALVKAQVGNSVRAIPAEIRALNTADAKLLLQAIYGFHAVVSTPTLSSHVVANETTIKVKSPEQQRITNLKATKDRASDALDAEREKLRKAKAMQTLSGRT